MEAELQAGHRNADISGDDWLSSCYPFLVAGQKRRLADWWRPSLRCGSFHTDRDLPDKQTVGERRCRLVLESSRKSAPPLGQTARRSKWTELIGIRNLSDCPNT